jgi:hypothetical protein
MLTRPCAALLAALAVVALTSCSGRGGKVSDAIFGKQYEYEEDLTIALDGSATLVVNASLASLVALRGFDLNVDPNARFDRDAVRPLFESPVAEVTRVSRPWKRDGRRFVQVRYNIPDIRRLSEAKAFAWSKYTLEQHDGHHIFTQTVGPSAMKPGSLQNYGWKGQELVAFRLHLPSRIVHHNARDVDSNETLTPERGNILRWEQYLADRLEGRPVRVEVKMESQSILRRTLWIFAGAFAGALVLIALMIWWFMRSGRHQDELSA